MEEEFNPARNQDKKLIMRENERLTTDSLNDTFNTDSVEVNAITKK